MTHQERFKAIAKITAEISEVFKSMAEIPEPILQKFNTLPDGASPMLAEGEQILEEARLMLAFFKNEVYREKLAAARPRETSSKQPS